MKTTKFTQSASMTLTAITLTACGGDGGVPSLQPKALPVSPSVVATPQTPQGAFEQNQPISLQATQPNEAPKIQPKAPIVEAPVAQLAVGDDIKSPNPFIKTVDVKNTPTFSANHYVRHTGSSYERAANPTKMAGLGAIATEDPTQSNPWLSNYVLGLEAVSRNGKPQVIATDSAGEAVEAFATDDNPNQGRKLGVLQASVDGFGEQSTLKAQFDEQSNRLLAHAHEGLTTDELTIAPQGNLETAKKLSPYYTHYNGLGYTAQAQDGGTQTYDYGKKTGATASVKTLQEQNSFFATTPRQQLIDNAMLAAKNKNYNRYFQDPNDSYAIDGVKSKDKKLSIDDEDSAIATKDSYKDHLRAGLIVYNDDKIEVGHEKGVELGYLVPAYGREENVYAVNDKTGELEVLNSIQITKLSDDIKNNVPLFDQEGGEIGRSQVVWHQKLSTFYNNKVIEVANNDSIRLFGKNMLGYEAGAEGEQLHDNTYIAKYTHKNKLSAIRPAKLHHVQYGRLTNNIDVLAMDSISDEHRIIYRDFVAHGTPNSVDTYFYRGTNHTSLEAMKAIKANGGIYRYHGHALTYNLGPYLKDKPKNTPTAFGGNSTDGSTIGNFVEATFDTAKAKVSGSIYNFINKDVAADENNFEKQELATFTGDVYGNTVVGTSAKVGTDQVGSLTASFFGESAAELGGNISAISRQEGYGDAKWGAVFGATRGSIVDNYNIIEQDPSTHQ